MKIVPKIKIIGIGGAGGNALTRMAKLKISGIELIAVNTDNQDLKKTQADLKIRIGRETTKGFGTGMNPELGRKAVEEQRQEIEAILKDSEMVFLTAGFGGGCLRGNSLIFTNPKGPVRIDSIKPGSMVFAFENNTLVKRRVLAAMKTGVKKVLELKTKNRTIYASNDHPFLRVKPLNTLSDDRFSKFDLEWIELQSLKIGDLVVVAKRLPNDGKSIELPSGSFSDEKFSRMFGFLLGDGWITRSKDSWGVYFSPSKNESRNQYYLKLINDIFGILMKRRVGKKSDWFQGHSKKIYEFLEKLGLHKSAKEKEIPGWVFSLPESHKKAFIIGLADADGSYSTQIGGSGLPKREIKFEMSSEKLIKGLKILADSIGLRTGNITSRTRTLKPPRSKEEIISTSWMLRIYKTHELLGELPHENARIGPDFLCKFRNNLRNKRVPDFFQNFGFNRIQSIKEVGNEEVYDITVEGSHNFIAEGFVVHNTGTGATPVVAEIAKSMGILTVAIVTRPFSFEGVSRKAIAQNGIKDIQDRVDSLVLVSNDKLISLVEKNTPLTKAFFLADEILYQAVVSIIDLILRPSLVTISFADVKSILSGAGRAFFGQGLGKGENRSQQAGLKALNSPLLEISSDQASRILFNISAKNLKLAEIDEVAKTITKNILPETKVIFGAREDERLKSGEMKVTLIATGF